MKHRELKNNRFLNFKWSAILPIILIFLSHKFTFSQNNNNYRTSPPPAKVKQNKNFMEQVRYGGNFGMIYSNQYSDILFAPNLLYEFNDYVSAGVGFQFNYISEQNNFKSTVYGMSIIGIANPVDFIQFSAELEQVRFNVDYQNFANENFWNTALFLGVGMRQDNFTLGIRYNLLHLNRNGYYSEPLVPFVRVSF